MCKKLLAFLFGFFAIQNGLFAECKGKIDLGPAYVRVDVLESGKTVKTMDMGALKGDAIFVWGNGFAIKPGFLVAKGEGRLAQGNIGLGWYVPVIENVCVLPAVGVSFSDIHTSFERETLLGDVRFNEKFHSATPYVSLDISYSITPCLKLIGVMQWGWARTHTKISPSKSSGLPIPDISQKSHSQGPSYALQLEYMITEKWSVNAGAAYNITLSREKHGIRGAGAKIGAAYWF